MVVLIIRPLNKTGSLSLVLPRVQKAVSHVSTVSIVSGFIIFGINNNYKYYKLFNTFWGNIILIAGILSLFVYYNVLSGGGIQSIFVKLKFSRKYYNYVPMLLLFMLSISLALMIVISKVLL